MSEPRSDEAGGARSFAFLVNPASGGGAAPDAVVPVARLLRDAGARVEVTYSPGPGAVRSLVAEAVDRGDVVVSVGGDGMLASLVGQVADLGGTLGLVPAGRGNDFARMVGVPDDAAGQAEILLHAPDRAVDLLELRRAAVGGGSGRLLVAGSVYAGVDARAAAYVDGMSRGRLRVLPPSWQYPIAAVRALATYTPGHYRVVVDGVEHRYDAATVVVANSGFYGNGMAIAPSARVDDGLLDVVVIEAASKRGLIRSLPKVYDGAHVDLPEVTVLRGTRVELSTFDRTGPHRTGPHRAGSAAAAIPVGGDGEPLGDLPHEPDRLDIQVLPGALRLLCHLTQQT